MLLLVLQLWMGFLSFWAWHKWSLKALVKSRYESDAKLQACDKDVRNTLRSSLRNRIHQQKVARESVASAEIGLLNKVAASPFSTRSNGGECCKLPQQGLGGPDRQSGFYRAMLCIARTIYMLSQDIYPSVRLSVTRRYSIETAKHTIKLFSPSVIHTILVFTIPNMAITRRSPLKGASNAGSIKIAIFPSISLYRGNDIGLR